jgi:hypothetical protein
VHWKLKHEKSGDYTSGYLRTIDQGIRARLHELFQVPPPAPSIASAEFWSGSTRYVFSYEIKEVDGDTVYAKILDWTEYPG